MSSKRRERTVLFVEVTPQMISLLDARAKKEAKICPGKNRSDVVREILVRELMPATLVR